MNPCTYCPTVAPRTFFGKLLLSLKAAIASGLLLQSISLPALSAPLLGALDQEIYLNIPENTQLEEALIDWGVAANMTVMINTSTVNFKITRGVRGNLSARAALAEILRGSGLTFSSEGNRIRVLDPSRAMPKSSKNSTTGKDEDVEKAIWYGKTDAGASSYDDVSAKSASTTQALPEVVVSAQKREERLQNVPVPVTAISADTLVESNQVLIRDYYSSIPGLNVMPSSLSYQIISIRGITTGVGNPAVGITVDDVPFGSSQGQGGGLVVPDIDPGDLKRIEVLRGPQGTLYGASSMGGLLKFVTQDPTTDGIHGHLQASVSGVQDGAEAGYGVHGSINLPLSDDLALRTSLFARRDPGYISNPFLGTHGINEDNAYGGLFSMLWRPSDLFSAKLTALIQNIEGNGSSEVDVGSGLTGFQQNYSLSGLQQGYLPGVGRYDRRVQVFSATLSGSFSGIQWTSVTGYNVNHLSDSYDLTSVYGPFTAQQFNGVYGTPITGNNTTYKFSQEFRVSGSIGSAFEWLLGGFFTHENSVFVDDILAESSNGSVVGVWDAESFPSTYREFAGFADLTYHFTDKFDVQVGARGSNLRQTYQQSDVGPYVTFFLGEASPISVIPMVKSSANPVTYLVTPKYQFSPDLMVYLRFASGYRAGGPNTAVGVPPAYDPDKTYDYEVGVKGDFLDHMLSFDGSLYYIDWKDIQLTLVDLQINQDYGGNGSRAKSEGVELSIAARPVDGLKVAAWLALNRAELTQPLPADSAGTYGASGDRLPFSSRVTGNLSIDDDFRLSNAWTGFAGAAASYVGDRKGIFMSDATRQDYPAYTKTDLHFGARSADWTVRMYVNNVADIRGVLNGGLGYYPQNAFIYIQPRTYGLSIDRVF